MRFAAGFIVAATLAGLWSLYDRCGLDELPPLHNAPGGDGYYLLYPHATHDTRQYAFDRSHPA